VCSKQGTKSIRRRGHQLYGTVINFVGMAAHNYEPDANFLCAIFDYQWLRAVQGLMSKPFIRSSWSITVAVQPSFLPSSLPSHYDPNRSSSPAQIAPLHS
jgi:hypothetical protein